MYIYIYIYIYIYTPGTRVPEPKVHSPASIGVQAVWGPPDGDLSDFEDLWKSVHVSGARQAAQK
jgi:hypothetical protein